MEGPIEVGTVVTLPFPYFDEPDRVKNRPALVIARPSVDYCVLCQITSQKLPFPNSVKLLQSDFVIGGIDEESQVRTDMIFTLHRKVLKNFAGKVSINKLFEVLSMIRFILTPKGN
jgi:hypothetical protein